MKFKVTTAGSFYSEQQAEKLRKLGFEFGINDYDMQRRPFKTGGDVEVEFKTLDELIDFSNEWGELIVSDGHIEIYDDYRE